MSSDIIALQQQLDLAHEELHCIELERDEALKALHVAEWQLHAIEKDDSRPLAYNNGVNLDEKFQYQVSVEEMKGRLLLLEERIIAADKRECDLREAAKTNQGIDRTLLKDESGVCNVHTNGVLNPEESVILSEKLVILEEELVAKESECTAHAESVKSAHALNIELQIQLRQLMEENEKLKSASIESERNLCSIKADHSKDAAVFQNEVENLTQLVRAEKDNGSTMVDACETKYKEIVANLEGKKSAIASELERLGVENEANIIAMKTDADGKLAVLSLQVTKLEEQLSAKCLEVQSKSEETAKVLRRLQDGEKAAEHRLKECTAEAKKTEQALQGKLHALEGTHSAETSSLTAQLSAALSAANTAKKEAADLQTKLIAAESAASAQEQRAEKVSRQLGKLQSREVENEQRSRQLESQLSGLEEREAVVGRREEAGRRANEGLEKKLNVLKTSKETLQAKADAAEARAVAAEAAAAAAEKETAKLRKELTKLAKKVDELGAKPQSSRSRASSVADVSTAEKLAAVVSTGTTVVADKDKSKPDKKPTGNVEKTSLTLAAVREELATERLHKIVAIISSILLLVILLAVMGHHIMSAAAASASSRRYSS